MKHIIIHSSLWNAALCTQGTCSPNNTVSLPEESDVWQLQCENFQISHITIVQG